MRLLALGSLTLASVVGAGSPPLVWGEPGPQNNRPAAGTGSSTGTSPRGATSTSGGSSPASLSGVQKPGAAAAPQTFVKPAACDDDEALKGATQCPFKTSESTARVANALCKQDCAGVEAAIAALTAGRRGVPEPELLFSARGLCLVQMGELKNGAAELERSLDFRRANSDALTALGVVACKGNNLPLAEQLLWEATWFDRFRMVSPVYAQRLLGEILIAQNKGDAARDLFQKAATSDPKAVGPRLSLARLALASGKRAEAISAARGAAETAPQNMDAALLLAEALITGANRQTEKDALIEGRTKAQAALSALGAKDPRRTRAQLLLARALIETGELDKAEQTLKAIPSQAPEAAQAQGLLAQLEVERKASLNVLEANRVTDKP